MGNTAPRSAFASALAETQPHLTKPTFTPMIKLFALCLALGSALPVGATPNSYAIDNGLMVSVPNIGLSRVETVTFCLNEVGRDRYQDLTTDSDYQGFEGCLRDQT